VHRASRHILRERERERERERGRERGREREREREIPLLVLEHGLPCTSPLLEHSLPLNSCTDCVQSLNAYRPCSLLEHGLPYACVGGDSTTGEGQGEGEGQGVRT
jgi:hypothetical protein